MLENNIPCLLSDWDPSEVSLSYIHIQICVLMEQGSRLMCTTKPFFLTISVLGLQLLEHINFISVDI